MGLLPQCPQVLLAPVNLCRGAWKCHSGASQAKILLKTVKMCLSGARLTKSTLAAASLRCCLSLVAELP